MTFRTQVISVIRNPQFIAGFTTTLAVVAGAAAGASIAATLMEPIYQEVARKEIAEAKKFYSALNKTGEFATPAQAVETLETHEAVEALRKYQGEETEVDVIERELEDFITDAGDVPDDDEWSYDDELPQRSEEVPYIIHYDEFMGQEKEYDQVTLSYFEGDDVLADERDGTIDHPEEVIGPDNLKFGHGSKDNNIVYIRNDNVELEFEVVRSRGKYVEEVLGFMEHADRHKTRKFRGDDE